MKRAMLCLVVAGILAFGAGLAVGADTPSGDTKPAAAPVVLPDAASAAIAKAFPKATMGKVSTYGKTGTIYNVQMTEGDKKFGVSVTDAGTITSIHTPTAIADLPAAVTAAVTAGANGATTVSAIKVEWRTNRRGTKPLDTPEIVYEVRLTQGDTAGVMQVAEDGTVKKPLELKPIKRNTDGPSK